MSRDLTDDLRALTEQANASKREGMKPRGAAAKVESSALLPGASKSGNGSSSFEPKGPKTLTSTDGLFTIFYPDTLETTIDSTVYTVGVIKRVP